MGLALKLYEQLSEATDERTRFRLIADAIGELEDAWPRPGEVARSGDVRESELRLQKEIEVVRKEIKEVELRLQHDIGEVRKEIEVVRKEIKDLELRLQKEIKQVDLQVQQVRVELKTTEANLRGAIHRQTLWVVGAVGSVVGLVRLLDWLLVSM
jgi:chromosome segregation ATPase